MAILKLYGWPKSTCTRRVAAVLHALKVPFELVELKIMEGEHKTPAYLEKQPFGQIPYIVRTQPAAPLNEPVNPIFRTTMDSSCTKRAPFATTSP
jgi:glutathione S-transferase